MKIPSPQLLLRMHIISARRLDSCWAFRAGRRTLSKGDHALYTSADRGEEVVRIEAAPTDEEQVQILFAAGNTRTTFLAKLSCHIPQDAWAQHASAGLGARPNQPPPLPPPPAEAPAPAEVFDAGEIPMKVVLVAADHAEHMADTLQKLREQFVSLHIRSPLHPLH